MTFIFNQTFQAKIQKKIKCFSLFLIISTLIFIISLIPIIIYHQHLHRYLFIVITTILSFLYFSATLILVKGLCHYRRVIHLFQNKDAEEMIGFVTKPDTYPITIDGLLYHQLIITTNKEQIFYLLYGVPFDEIINQKVRIYLNHQILFAYEVLDE